MSNNDISFLPKTIRMTNANFPEAFKRVNPQVPIKLLKDGQELVDFLDACPDNRLPVIIVLDYKMPKLTSAEVLHYLSVCHRFNSYSKKIVWSTSTREKDIAECMPTGSGKLFYLSKNLRRARNWKISSSWSQCVRVQPATCRARY